MKIGFRFGEKEQTFPVLFQSFYRKGKMPAFSMVTVRQRVQGKKILQPRVTPREQQNRIMPSPADPPDKKLQPVNRLETIFATEFIQLIKSERGQCVC